MTWQGGKRRREVAATSPAFARLRPLVGGTQTDIEESFGSMAHALSTYGAPVKIHVHLSDSGNTDHWEVQSGSGSQAVHHHRPVDAHVHVVMRPETWLQIAQGRLAPFDALFDGKLRVGGDQELAKNITKHLSDPSVPFVPPC